MAVETLKHRTTALHVVLDRAAKRQERRSKPSTELSLRVPITPIASTVEERACRREELLEQVNGLLIKGEFTEALRLTTHAAEEYRALEDYEGQALTLHLLGSCYKRLNDYPAALASFQESCERFLELGDAIKAANALLAKATIQRIMGLNDAAILVTKQCREIYREAGERLQEMRAAMNLSVLFKQQGDVAAAQELLFECLTYFEQSERKLEAAKVLLNIASNYCVLKNPQQTIHFANRGVPLFEECGDLHHLAMGLSVLGGGYLELGDHETALEQFRRALPIAEKLDIRSTIAIILGDMGEILMRFQHFDEAREVLERCLRINGKEENRLVYCGSSEQLGRLYANSTYAGRDLEKALLHLVEARTLAEEQKGDMVLPRICQALAEVYEERGDFKNALEAYRAYHAAQEYIFNDESDKRVLELQTRFEVEKTRKDAEIAHLRSVELAAALEEAERLRALADAHARTDTLTGVENRRALEERLVQEFARARRNNRPLAVALLDIDYFKKINDTFGHATGDGALRHLTTVLRSQFRLGDYIARYGGEEFALLFPETDLCTAIELCDRLRVWVAASAWNLVHPGMHQVTMSVGVSVFAGDNKSIEAIFEEADANLYRAKQSGRNKVVG